MVLPILCYETQLLIIYKESLNAQLWIYDFSLGLHQLIIDFKSGAIIRAVMEKNINWEITMKLKFIVRPPSQKGVKTFDNSMLNYVTS